MNTILLSFSADWYSELVAGRMKFEYRKYFPEGETKVFFYVSNPIKAVSGVAIFAARENLSDWIEKYSTRPQSVQNRIREYMEDCRYAMPIKSFQATESVPLEKLKRDLPGFVVPRMYYYLSGATLEYLENNCHPCGEPLINDFSTILDEDIC